MTGPKKLRPMRVLVTGGRVKTLQKLGIDPGAVHCLVVKTLNKISSNGARKIVVIHGGADGVDASANQWADATHTEKLVFPIAKEDWDRVGSIAGNLRNTQMMDDGKPDVCLQFPGGGGTADMASKAKAAGKPVIEVKLDA